MIKTFDEYSDNYMLGKPTIAWLKRLLRTNKFIDTKDSKFIDCLSKIKLSEYQTLFDYYNFCTIHKNIRLAYNNIDNYRYSIADWCWYLMLCQCFSDELKNTAPDRDLYTEQYKQIMNLPKLTGNLDEDKIIFENVVYKDFFKQESIVRNAIMLYYIYYRGKQLI